MVEVLGAITGGGNEQGGEVRAEALAEDVATVQRAINEYYGLKHDLEDWNHTLENLRAQTEVESGDTQAELQQEVSDFERKIAEGEVFFSELEAGLKKESAREALQKARIKHEYVERELFNAFTDKRFEGETLEFMEKIPRNRWTEIKEPISKPLALWIRVSGRLSRVAGATLAYALGDTAAENAGLSPIWAKFISVPMSHLGASFGSQSHKKLSANRHKIDYAKVIFQRMSTPGRRQFSSYERFHRILLDVALSEEQRARRKSSLIRGQYGKLDRQFEGDIRRGVGDAVVMGLAVVIVESAKLLRWLL